MLAGSSATLINVTIAYNTAQSGGGIDVASGGAVTLGNSLVAKNTASTNPDVQGVFTSDGNNLIGNVGTATGFIGSDLVGTSLSPINPHIGPLANNGGPTKTIALLSGSPAINAGNSSLAPAFGITTDQRGEPRFAPGGDSMVDIGADEVDSVFASVATDGVDETEKTRGPASVRTGEPLWFISANGEFRQRSPPRLARHRPAGRILQKMTVDSPIAGSVALRRPAATWAGFAPAGRCWPNRVPASIMRQGSRGAVVHFAFSVVGPFFLRRRKTRKIPRTVQRLCRECELDTWVNEKMTGGRTAWNAFHRDVAVTRNKALGKTTLPARHLSARSTSGFRPRPLRLPRSRD